MKLVIGGDFHVDAYKIGKNNPETDLDLRVEDFLKAIDRMIDHAIDIKADMFVMNGDLFKHRTAEHSIETAIAERFKRIADNMKLVIVLGNHDYTARGLNHGYHTYSILDRAKIDNCEILLDITHKNIDGCDIVFYPYYDLKRLTHFKENKQLIEWVSDTIDSFDIKEDSTLFIGHGTPEGTIMGEAYFDLELIDEPILPKSLLHKFDKAFFSHIHRMHAIDDTIFHIGSPERIDFSEEKDDKGFVVYDTKTKKMEFISTNPRPMKHIKLDLTKLEENPTEYVINHINSIENLEESIVKVDIELTLLQNGQIDKISISNLMQKAFEVKSVGYSYPREVRSRLPEMSEDISISKALKKVIDNDDLLTEAEKQQITILGNSIIAVSGE